MDEEDPFDQQPLTLQSTTQVPRFRGSSRIPPRNTATFAPNTQPKIGARPTNQYGQRAAADGKGATDADADIRRQQRLDSFERFKASTQADQARNSARYDTLFPQPVRFARNVETSPGQSSATLPSAATQPPSFKFRNQSNINEPLSAQEIAASGARANFTGKPETQVASVAKPAEPSFNLSTPAPATDALTSSLLAPRPTFAPTATGENPASVASGHTPGVYNAPTPATPAPQPTPIASSHTQTAAANPQHTTLGGNGTGLDLSAVASLPGRFVRGIGSVYNTLSNNVENNARDLEQRGTPQQQIAKPQDDEEMQKRRATFRPGKMITVGMQG